MMWHGQQLELAKDELQLEFGKRRFRIPGTSILSSVESNGIRDDPKSNNDSEDEKSDVSEDNINDNDNDNDEIK